MTESVASEYVPAVREESTIVRAAPGDVVNAFEEYRKIQSALDMALPDCLMEIQRKKFRKKNYWRAVATAFNLTLELVSERESTAADGDWGFLIVYRATAPNGRYADGDGTCFASEKGEGQGSVHNVRAHASTRAVNRAISNLVGFGEVSAEEMLEEKVQARAAKRSPDPVSTPSSSTGSESPGQFDTPIGFGKHKTQTWRQMTEGEVGGDRYSYLEWLASNIKGKLAKDPDHKYAASDRERLIRVEKCLALIERRADERAAGESRDDNTDEPPPDDNWEGEQF